MAKLRWVVFLDSEDIKKIRELVNKGEFESVSHFIRRAVKDKLKSYEEKPIVF